MTHPVLAPRREEAPNLQLQQESLMRMHALFTAGPIPPRTWVLLAVVLAVLGLMAAIWDPQDLGDGLVLGSGGSVSAVWDSAQSGLEDFLFGSPSAPSR